MFKLDEAQISTYLICVQCKRAILRPHDGVIVQGNIYVASADGGGLVGGSFPKEPFTAQDLSVTVFCKGCFLEVLGWKNERPKTFWLGKTENKVVST